MAFFGGYISAGQGLSSIKIDTVYSIIYVLAEGADAESLVVNGVSDYQLKGDTLYIDESDSSLLPVTIMYRYPSPLLVNYPMLHDTTKYEPRDPTNLFTPNYINNATTVGLLDEYSNIYKSGAITRGITIGNRQNLYVNSTLNLQLQGEISDDLTLTASITDQNIPYQPEGNTQQLRDFDNVLIALNGRRFELMAGDIVMRNPANYGHFLKYYKNQQGFKLSTQHDLADDWVLDSRASIAIAKGKFATKRLQAIEGVQGPYRLRGAENERFITILANSEKVFLDGEPLTRGFDNDYIIDYNLGEITFTSNVVITRFSRIRVDYEYAQQYYVRSNLLLSEHFSDGRHEVYFDYYRASDNPARPLQFSNDEQIINQLSSLGDPDMNGVFIANESNITNYQPGNFYHLIDTVVNNQSYKAYQYVTNTDSAIQVIFTEVGEGNGDYVSVDNNAYGRVFRWIAPDDGVAQGWFAPVQQVVTPQSQEMAVAGAVIGLTSSLTLENEVAVSSVDQNRYSGIGDGDNTGLAWRGKLKYERQFSDDFEVTSDVTYEYDEASFRPIDRFRSIDFDRNWSYPFPYDSVSSAERLLSTHLTLQLGRQKINYGTFYRNRSSTFEGWQQSLDHHFQLSILHIDGSHFLMDNQVLMNQSYWRKSLSEIYLGFDKWKVGGYYNLDQNRISDLQSDSVISSAMYYLEKGIFIRSHDWEKVQLNVSLSDRSDSRPDHGELAEYTQANQLKMNVNWDQSTNNRLTLQGIYRKTDRKDTVQQPSDNILQGRLVARNAWWQKAITHQLIYQTQNSRELKREYIYTQVGAGQGTHTWRDENENGVAELTEFYEAINMDEKNYIRLFVPTDEYIEAFQTNYQHTLNLSFPSQVSWPGFLKHVSKLSANASISSLQKVNTNSAIKSLNPYDKSKNDGSLLHRKATVNYGIFYNRSRPGLGFSINQTYRDLKQLNINGFELDERQNLHYKLRYNISNSYQFTVGWVNGAITHMADFLDNRNFELATNQYQSEVSWTPGIKLRFTLGGSWGQKKNILNESNPESVATSQGEGSVTWIDAGTRNISAKFIFNHIDFNGDTNNYLGYVLLDALQPGNNYRINFNMNQTLKNGLQLSVNYFGRKSSKQALIHSGSMNLTAFF